MTTDDHATTPDLDLTQTQLAAISEKMGAAQESPIHVYPWDSLEEGLRQKGRDGLLVLAYGSLVNRASAAHTLTQTAGTPAIGFGIRRVFNYIVPEHNPRYGPPPDSVTRAALNVVPTGRIGDVVNGVLLEVPLDEIGAFRSREVGYDLVSVPCIPWHDRNAPPFLAHTLHCPDEPRGGVVRTAQGINPHPEYYRVCREGAEELGESFLETWLATSFLADLSTPVRLWEAGTREREE